MPHLGTIFLPLSAAILICSVECKEKKKCEETIYDYMLRFADKCGVSNRTKSNKIGG